MPMEDEVGRRLSPLSRWSSGRWWTPASEGDAEGVRATRGELAKEHFHLWIWVVV